MAKKIVRVAKLVVEAGEGRNRFAAGTEHGKMTAAMAAAAKSGKLKLEPGVVETNGRLYSIRTGDGYTAWGVAEETCGHSIQNAVWSCGISPRGELLPFSKLQLIETLAGWASQPQHGGNYNVGGQISNFAHRQLVRREGRTWYVTDRGLALAQSTPDELRAVIGSPGHGKRKK